MSCLRKACQNIFFGSCALFGKSLKTLHCCPLQVRLCWRRQTVDIGLPNWVSLSNNATLYSRYCVKLSDLEASGMSSNNWRAFDASTFPNAQRIIFLSRLSPSPWAGASGSLDVPAQFSSVRISCIYKHHMPSKQAPLLCNIIFFAFISNIGLLPQELFILLLVKKVHIRFVRKHWQLKMLGRLPR